jgi:hypothetical protein
LPSGAGVNTVHAQHARHLGATIEEPRNQFLLDLAEAMRARQEQGDYIMIGTDINQDVTSRPIRQFFRNLNLHNAIIMRHPNSSPPATCRRNENRVQIDVIYCSIGIVPVAAGFLKYGDGTPSDHRVLWSDFRKAGIIGARAADFRPPVLGLRASDPRDVHRYNTQYFAKLQAAKVPSALSALSKIEPQDFTQAHQHKFNRLQKVNRDI